MIRASNITKKYGNRMVLDNVSIDIAKEKNIGIIGKNGAGKTTLLNIILGITKYDKGSINYNFDKEKFNNIVGVQMQDGYFENLLKVKEVCNLFCDLYNIPRSRTDELLKEFELEHVKKLYLSKLSGGERQKVNIILSIIHNPEIVFLDEVSSGLDAISRNFIYNYLIKLTKDKKTIVLVSHYFEEIWNLCENVIVLDQGKLIYSGKVKEFSNSIDDFRTKVIELLGGTFNE